MDAFLLGAGFSKAIGEEMPLLKELSSLIQDQLTATDGTGKDAKLRFLSGTSTRMKLQRCLVDWRNVVDAKDQSLPCNDETKLRLPVRYLTWLEGHINEVNGLNCISETETKN